MKRLLLLALVACHPKPQPTIDPVLPGDGDTNTAKPPPPLAPPSNDPWAGAANLITAPPPTAPAPVALPTIDTFKLSNGLEVFVVKSDRLPVVSMQLAIRAGRNVEPRSRLGVSEATADMLVKGTKRHDAKQLAKAIDFVGGTIAADATFEATLVSCSVMSRDLKTCLELVPEVIAEPTFPDEELQKVREGMLANVRERLDDASAMASVQAQNLLWGNNHVRGWINSDVSVAAIKRDDLLAWHKNWFVPGNAMLVVAGDVDGKKIKASLEAAFSIWKKAPVPPSPMYKEPELSGIRIRLVDKPGQTQTHIRIAQIGIRHDDPRFFDSLVWNYVLGGGAFSSRLMKVVRVEGGKTYGASSTFDRNGDKGSFVVQTFTRNSEAIATVKLLTEQVAKMAKDGPTKDEVASAIANLAGGYGLRFQSAADVGAALIGAELHGFGEQYLQNYPIAVGKVDVASAKQAAAEILDPKNFVLVLVGDAKDVEPQLKSAGWRYEKVAFTDVMTPPVEQAAPPVDPKTADAARKFLEEAITAKGGRAKLGALKSFKLVADGQTQIGGQSVPVHIERVVVLPDKLRMDATLTVPTGKVDVIIGVDKQVGWQRAPNPQTGVPTLSDIPPSQMPAIDFERWREPELILLHATEKTAKIAPLADDTLDGKPMAVFKLASPSGAVDVTIFIDKKTKQVTRISYADGGVTNVDDFADYRDVRGIQIAHKRTSSGGGRSTVLELKSVELDPTVDPLIFAKPAGPPTPTPPAPTP